jgi:predicted phosphodiesterase
LRRSRAAGTIEDVNGWRSLLDDDETRGVRWVGRPLLCISDIHGDLLALESVLAAVRHLDLCGVVALGDHCLGGPRPFDVWQRLQSLGATLARGPSDLALGAIHDVDHTPHSATEEARLLTFRRTKRALGDVVCRRLAELPTTVVVSLDDTRGVMAMHGCPSDDSRGLVNDERLDEEVGCVAEDAIVTGATHVPFARLVAREAPWSEDEPLPAPAPLLVVNAGSVGMSPVRRPDGRRTAHAVLVVAGDDEKLHALGQDVLVARAGGSRRAM